MIPKGICNCSSLFRALKAKEEKIASCDAAEAEFFTCHEAAKRRSVPSHSNQNRLLFHMFVWKKNHTNGLRKSFLRLDILRAEGADGRDNFLDRKVSQLLGKRINNYN